MTFGITETPCRNCEERRVTAEYNCHMHCDRYREYDADNIRRRKDNYNKYLASEYEADRKITIRAKWQTAHKNGGKRH